MNSDAISSAKLKSALMYAGLMLLALLDLAWFHLFLCRKGMSTYDWVVTQRSLPPHKQCAPALKCLQLARGQVAVHCLPCKKIHPSRNAAAAAANKVNGENEDPEGCIRDDDSRGRLRMSASLPEVCRRASGKVLPLVSEDPKAQLPCAKENFSAPSSVSHLAESEIQSERDEEAARTDVATYDHQGSGASLIQSIFGAGGSTNTSRPSTPPCNAV